MREEAPNLGDHVWPSPRYYFHEEKPINWWKIAYDAYRIIGDAPNWGGPYCPSSQFHSSLLPFYLRLEISKNSFKQGKENEF